MNYQDTIAIVGMSGRFPGADNVNELWQNLKNGVESIRPFSSEELAAAGITEAQQADPTFVNAGAVLADYDKFDAKFFGMTPREAALTDPQHRLFLQCAWSALEAAGYDPQGIDVPVGVFGGVAENSYYRNNVATHHELLEKLGRYPALIGREREFAITRAAFKLDLRGPVISLNTACSTSLVAIHLAAQSLLNGECDMALAGGARLNVPTSVGYNYVQNGILSPDGHCRAFDENAAGTVMGNGVAIIVLKRYEDAVADGDTIHALIRGSAVNNDGLQKIGYTAPSPTGQADVIADAIAFANIDPRTIGYIEAHGTATSLGDPIEMSGLTAAFGEYTTDTQFCALGSVKTNLGHLDAAAGVTGVIKAALMLKHGEFVPSLHYTAPNPQIDFANSPFFVETENRAWESDTPRRAGISSFGLGGTNAHVIIEEAPAQFTTDDVDGVQIFPLSARTKKTVAEIAQNLADHLATQESVFRDLQIPKHPSSSSELADAAYTLAKGRHHFEERAFVVAAEHDDASKQLQEIAKAKTTYIQDAKIAFLFAGGGAQHAGMARDLYHTAPIFRESFTKCANFLNATYQIDICPSVLSDDETETRPSIALPALFSVQYALAQQWAELGIEPAAMIGHSMGEYTAACLAGVFSLEDALGIVVKRGQLFETLAEGGMLSVPLSEAEAQKVVGDALDVAAVNKPDACVLSGTKAQITSAMEAFSAKNITTRQLKIDVAAHSSLVEPILDEFHDFLQGIEFHAPNKPIISNVSGDWMTDDEATTPAYWVSHLRQTVRYADGAATLLNGYNVLIECGPGQVLTSLTRKQPAKTKQHLVLPTLRHPNQTTRDDVHMLSSFGKLWQAGVDVDWDVLFDGQTRRRVALPTYPFEQVRHWMEPLEVETRRMNSREGGNDSDVGSEGADVSGNSIPETVEEIAPTQTLNDQIKDVLFDLSGIPHDEMDDDATFLELGFDSLLLTQVNGALQHKFGVPITFRQLFEEAPSVAALANYLRGQGVEAATVERGEEKRMDSRAGGNDSVEVEDAPVKGPWKPLNTRATTLTMQQETHLNALIERITSRAPKTKAWVQKYRPKLADPRTVAGFRRAWKEIVFPVVSDRSQGAYIWDIDGNKFIDVAMGFGVAMYGHNPPFLMKAIAEQMKDGIETGPQNKIAGEAVELITQVTGQPRVAFCNTGSEAVLAAIRMARTVTNRPKIATFINDYHGIFDEVLARRVGRDKIIPRAPGIPHNKTKDIILLDYDDPASLDKIREHAHEIAAVIVEPVQSRNPDLQPRDFLHQLRALTHETDIALIFDEMITGFRIAPGGAQEHFGIRADIATYGKAIAAGIPIGVVAGQPKYLDALDGGMWRFGDNSAPEVGVTWFAGTFVRHPFALAAARASMRHLLKEGSALQANLNKKTRRFVDAFNAYCEQVNAPVRMENFASFFLVTFQEPTEFDSLFYFFLRDNGVHVTEGRAAYISTAHTEADVDALIAAYTRSIQQMQAAGFLAGTPQTIALEQKHAYSIGLTEGQMEIWLSAQGSDEANAAYNLSNVMKLGGKLDVMRVKLAVQQLVNRHDALRATFAADGSMQTIRPKLNIDITEHDLSILSEDERKQHIAELRERAVTTPFDLENGPLIRADLIRLAPEQHELWLTAHHIVVDGWSSGVLMREAGLLYAGEALPAPMPLRDFVAWQQVTAESAANEAAEKYWLDQFAEEPAYLEMPTDRNRPARKTYVAERREREISAELTQQLRKVGAKNGSTLFGTLLATYQAFTYRLSGQTDITLGVAAALQSLVNSESVVMHGANLLPMRVQLDGSQSFGDLLKQTRSVVLNGFEHQTYTYGALLRQLNIQRSADRLPLVSVAFNLDPTMGNVSFGDLEVQTGSNPRSYETFDMFFNVVVTANGLRAECTFNRDLFDATTIERWLANYERFLSGIIAASDTPIDLLPILTDADIAQFDAWNDNAYADSLESINGIFESFAAEQPNAPALVFDGTTMSYGDLNRRANQLAHWLQSQGVTDGTRVGLFMDRSFEMGVAVLGVLKAGAAYVPIDPQAPAERIGFVLEDCSADMLLTLHTQRRQLAIQIDKPIHAIDALPLSDCPDVTPESKTTGDSLACLIYTSGSTGRPKGAMLPHRGLCNYAQWYGRRWQIGREDAMLQKAPFGFDAATWELLVPLLTGGRVILAKPGGQRDARYLIDLIAQEDVTHLFVVPVQLRMLLEHDTFEQCDKLRYVMCGGDKFPEDLIARFRGLSDAALLNMYGPTEATIGVTFWDTDETVDGAPVTPLGRFNDNVTGLVVNPALQPQPIGVIGELLIGGVQTGDGYWNRPELTAEKFISANVLRDACCVDENSSFILPATKGCPSSFYRTGDLVKWLPSGAIQYIGRADTQVKLRGLRIELGEIEHALIDQPSIKEAAVLVRRDSGDERLVAYVTPSNVDTNRLRPALSNRLPRYMIPTHIVSLDSFPLTSSGKIDRKKLPAPVTETHVEPVETLAAPRDALELRIAQSWERSLGVRPISIHDNFFELGGHSLMAVRLFSELEKVAGKKLPLATLLQAPTVAQLAAIVRDEGWEPNWSSIVPIRAGGSKRPLFYIASYQDSVLNFHALTPHLDAARPLYGIQPQGLDGDRPIHNTIEEMATHYIQEMKTVQPEGPYLLAGHCAGAWIAYEMARQLEQGGESAEFVGIVDSPPPNRRPETKTPLRYYARRALYYMRDKRLLHALSWQYKLNIQSKFVTRFGGAQAKRIEEVRRVHKEAFENYVAPCDFTGTLTVFRSSELASFEDKQWHNRWSELTAGEMKVDVVPGTHATLLHEPNVRILAQKLEQGLNGLGVFQIL